MANDYDRFIWQPGEVEVLEPGQLPSPSRVPSDITWSPEEETFDDGAKYSPSQPRDRRGRWTTGGVGGALTPYDTEAIVAMRAEVQGLSSTHEINTPERGQLRRNLAARLERQNGVYDPTPDDMYTVAKGRTVDIILGPPAAGKSSFADPLRRSRRSMLIDSDEIKQGLPEFNGGKHAGRVHEESDMLLRGQGGRNGLIGRAVARGDNITMPIVGGTASKVDQLGRFYKANGYKVNLYYVDLPIHKAARRAVDRQTSTGRFVDPAYVLSVDSKPRKAYKSLKGESWVNESLAVSTDVPRGSAPKRIRV